MNQFVKVVIVLASFLLSYSSSAQIGVSISRIAPRAELGVVMKPTNMYELSYQFTEIGDNFRFVTSIGFINFKTREDTLRTYGYIGGSVDVLSSGYELYENYFSIPISFKSDYKFISGRFSPIIGLDAQVFLNSYYYEQKIDNLIELSEQGASTFLGLHLRAGMLYSFDDIVEMEFNIGKSATLENGDGNFRFWRIGLGVTYKAW